jgi:hypothetical protein
MKKYPANSRVFFLPFSLEFTEKIALYFIWLIFVLHGVTHCADFA